MLKEMGVDILVEFDSTVGKLAECSSLLDLCKSGKSVPVHIMYVCV